MSMRKKVSFASLSILLGMMLAFGAAVQAAQTTVTITNADSLDGWGHLRAEVEAADKKEGQGAFVQKGAVGEEIAFWKFLEEPIDTKITEDNGAIKLWVKVDNLNGLRDGDLVLNIGSGSTGGPAADEYVWWIHTRDLQEGWNEVTVKFHNEEEPGNPSKRGNPDLSAINFVRAFAFTTADNAVYLDDIRFVNLSADDAGAAAEQPAPAAEETPAATDNAAPATDNAAPATNPKTGDTASMALYAMVAAGAAGTLLVLLRQRRANQAG